LVLQTIDKLHEQPSGLLQVAVFVYGLSPISNGIHDGQATKAKAQSNIKADPQGRVVLVLIVPKFMLTTPVLGQ
jgi:hypothetical protein